MICACDNVADVRRREAFDRAISFVGDPHQFKGLVDAFFDHPARTGVEEFGSEAQCFSGGHLIVVAGVLCQVAYALTDGDTVAHTVHTEDFGAAACWARQPQQEFNGGLPRR
jgi:hypothetical protein